MTYSDTSRTELHEMFEHIGTRKVSEHRYARVSTSKAEAQLLSMKPGDDCHVFLADPQTLVLRFERPDDGDDNEVSDDE